MREVALVTGGAVRIGRVIAERLAAEDYAVAIHCSRSRKEAEALKVEILARGGRAAVVTADLADAAAASCVIAAARAALGPVTLLVNNASLFEDDAVTGFDADVWDRQFAANLRAPALLARDMANALPPGATGAIVNIIDQRVWRLTPRFFSYTLTKAALWAATKTMAQALAPAIRVNAVGPGPTLKSERQDGDEFSRQSAAVPLGRGGAPDEIADAVLYLARAKSVTGQMIAVDGGQHLAWRTPDVADVRE